MGARTLALLENYVSGRSTEIEIEIGRRLGDVAEGVAPNNGICIVNGVAGAHPFQREIPGQKVAKTERPSIVMVPVTLPIPTVRSTL